MKFFSDGTLQVGAQDTLEEILNADTPQPIKYVQYEARGCTYTLDFYEDGYVNIVMFNSMDEVQWSCCTHTDRTDRAIDVVRSARRNAQEIGLTR